MQWSRDMTQCSRPSRDTAELQLVLNNGQTARPVAPTRVVQCSTAGHECMFTSKTSIVMSMSQSVCPIACLENHTDELRQIFVHVARGRGSVLLCRRCDILRTSGFVDDVMYSHSGPYGASCVCL